MASTLPRLPDVFADGLQHGERLVVLDGIAGFRRVPDMSAFTPAEAAAGLAALVADDSAASAASAVEVS